MSPRRVPPMTIGSVFGRLTVIGSSPKRGNNIAWTCTCTCGKTVSVAGTSLRLGRTQSCGCLRIQRLIEAKGRNRIHGQAVNRTATYRCWTGLRERCFNPRHQGYSNYGGRGITVCPQWNSFEQFQADMGERPFGMSIDRIDNDKGYEPTNCRWATPVQQMRNRRTSWHVFDVNDESISFAEAARTLAMSESAFYGHIRKLYGYGVTRR